MLGSLASLEVHALSLGKITIQSALGEPLRGEIDVTDVNPAEASSLKVGLASAETFRAAGMDYPSSATGLEVKLLRRADNRPYLRLNSSRAITEPFMDLIVEANWDSGHVTRDYTMLFDPPRAIASSAPLIAPTVPMLSRPSVPVAGPVPTVRPTADLASSKTRDKETPEATSSAPKPSADPADSAPERSASPADRTDPPAERAIAPIGRPVPQPAPAATARAPKPAKTLPDDSSSEQVIVKKGDTANKIAARNKPADVSLDQMLVALLKQNPNAFIGGNVNTIKSGAVLDIPKTETVSALSSTEARKIIVAQSKDFNAFRRKLSESVSATAATSPDRQSSGKVQTEVQDHAQIAPVPDTLKLSQGTIQAGPTGKADDKIVKDKQAKSDALRVAELNKNISDLNKLGIPPVTASRPAAVPAITVATPSGVAVPVPPAAPKASAAATPSSAPLPAASVTTPSADAALPIKAPASAAADPLAAASAPATQASAASASLKKPVVKAAPPPEPEPEPELMDQLTENAVPLLGGVGILGLLGGLAFMRSRKKKSKAAPVDSSFLESRLQPDSFFGASGGSRVNTNNGDSLPGGSSMAYTPSQMDASGDVDPVAEADVYLAYGRDEQAEDILKEALHTHPGRPAIHAKLLEIYAKRRDTNAFESLAGEALKLTQGQGPEWAYIIELGNELDPGNPLYEAREPAPDEPLQASASAPAPASGAMSSAASAEMDMDMDVDLDLDMDFSLDDEAPQSSAAPITVGPTPTPVPAPPAPVIPAPAPVAPVPLMSSPASATPPASHLDDLDLGLDFDMTPTPAAPVSLTKPPAAAPTAPDPIPEIDLLSNGLDFTPMNGLDFTPMPPVVPEPAPAPKPAAAAPAHDNGMMEFDLDAFSLDLTPAPAPIRAPEAAETEQQAEEDPLEIKFMLAEEFHALGDTDGARSLADEVVAKAKGPLKTKAQSFLNALS
ncbi:MAG: fimbrial protein FimV [Polaromonas sp.]|nr:fimbrial protein FimV [Polaromonas sp.]